MGDEPGPPQIQGLGKYLDCEAPRVKAEGHQVYIVDSSDDMVVRGHNGSREQEQGGDPQFQEGLPFLKGKAPCASYLPYPLLWPVPKQTPPVGKCPKKTPRYLYLSLMGQPWLARHDLLYSDHSPLRTKALLSGLTSRPT